MSKELKKNKKWRLTKGIRLYPWQKDCISSWFSAGYRGTVKVVTGAGKTILGLAIAEHLHNEHNSDLHIAIVVPTIVLMNQWYDEIIDRSNLPPTAIGRLGGGYKDDFSNDTRILICVLVSASKKLPEIVKNADIGKNLLFIADECHRTGATQMSRVLTTPRKYSLGLSATPERTDDEEDDIPTPYNESNLASELGPLVYEMTLAEALKLEPLETTKLSTCALLHDIGKIGISDEILNKPDKLTAKEWEIVKGHSQLGANITSHVRQLAPCIAGILHHHEWYDGTGYPKGLKGEDIPLEARILAIADAFAAMTSDRSYCKALPREEALEEIKQGAGKQFDPNLVELFMSIMETAPAATAGKYKRR